MSDVPRPGSYTPYQAVEPEGAWHESYRYSASGAFEPPHSATDMLGEAQTVDWRLRMAMIQVRMSLASALVIVLCCLLPTVLLARELFVTGGTLGGAWAQLAPAALVLCVFAMVAAVARVLVLFATVRELHACKVYLGIALSGVTVDLSPHAGP